MSAPHSYAPGSAPSIGASPSHDAAHVAATDGPARPAVSFSGIHRVPTPVNEPVLGYVAGSPERAALAARVASMAAERVEIPLIIGGHSITTGVTGRAVMPHDHHHVLADWHKASREHVQQAIAAALAARREWASWPWEDRAAVLLKAAELLATEWRTTVLAATMLGQSKTAHQAEIDAACELIDFWRYNPSFARAIYEEQPVSTRATWNQMDYRPLEGFVYAVSPFNFTAIAGNLPTAPLLMGNVVVWKPAATAMLSAYHIVRLLEAAGLPPGVLNFVPGDPEPITAVALSHRALAGVHFTGSTAVFNAMWEQIGRNIGQYAAYPRVVGETGGKDFILAHASADPVATAVAIVRGGFEYQGQKCSAASRVYIPRSLWPEVRDRVVGMIDDIRMGDVADFRNFMGAVIDQRALTRIGEYLAEAGRTSRILAGGRVRGEQGYFVEPTLVQTDDPDCRLLREEIFGPVVTAYVYEDAQWEQTLALVDRTSPYGLTGSVFARDRGAALQAAAALRDAAGNFYINDKPTGAVVGQQPFGGARASGTNDKAGSRFNLERWVSPRAIKETFAPALDYRYPFLDGP